MDYVYEDERIPLQIRRLLIFDEICKLAKKQPDEIIHLSRFTQLSLGVMYLKGLSRLAVCLSTQKQEKKLSSNVLESFLTTNQ